MQTSLSQQAYVQIREKLLGPTFNGGDRISESNLAKELGISRTPVREAIRRLQSEGLVYQIPRKGTYLTQLDRNQIIEAYEVREALECLAVEKATKLMKPKQRLELELLCKKMHDVLVAMRDESREVLEGGALKEYLTADLAFHLLILRAANNTMAMRIVSHYHVRNHSHGLRSHRRTLHHLAWTWAAHKRISRAVRMRNPRAARFWMKRHVRASLRDGLAAFDEHLASLNPGQDSMTDLAISLDVLVSQLTEPTSPAV